jgi:hypothetical protein
MVFTALKSALGIKGKGYLVDPVDTRDVSISTLNLNAPTNLGIDLVTPAIIIKDQGATSSCVGQSIATAMQIAYIQDYKPCPPLSASFVYYNARFDENDLTDNGTYIRLAMRSVMKIGLCEEANWSFSSLNINKKPSILAYRSAMAQRGLRGYYRIQPTDLQSVIAAIHARKPIVAGWNIGEKFFAAGTYVDKTMLGTAGHAMVIAGHRLLNGKDYFKIINSWGTGFGSNGFVWADVDFVSSAKDMWAVDV